MTIIQWLDILDSQVANTSQGTWQHTHKDCKHFMSSDFIDRPNDPNGVGLLASDLNQTNAYLYATEDDMAFIATSHQSVPQLTALLREACQILALMSDNTVVEWEDVQGCRQCRARQPNGSREPLHHENHCPEKAAREFLARDVPVTNTAPCHPSPTAYPLYGKT